MTYEVTMQTKPGFYAQYEKCVSVNAEHEEDAEDKAWAKIQRSGFQDHSRSMWRATSIVCTGA